MGKLEVEHCDLLHSHYDTVKEIRGKNATGRRNQRTGRFFQSVFRCDQDSDPLCVVTLGDVCL